MKTARKLTPQQECFAQEVAKGENQSQAYRAAYKRQKMTPKQIHEEASKLAANPKVHQRITELLAIGAEIAGLDAAKIAKEIARVAHSDIGGIMHADGRVKLPNELDIATRAAVSSFKIDEFGRIEYKFWDKNTALTNAAKISGMFEADNKQKVDPMAALVAAVLGNVQGVAKGDDE